MIFSLLGCHLFADARVECVAGEACAADSAADSGSVDTGAVPGGPVLGWALSLEGEDRTVVRRYNARGQQVGAWDRVGAVGAVAVESGSYDGVVVDGSTLASLPAEGEVTRFDLPVQESFDVALGNGVAWIATGNDVYGFSPRSSFELSLAGGGLGWGTSLELDGDNLWVVDAGDGRPDVLRYDVQTYELLDLRQDVDTTVARIRAVFTGPAGEPYGCSGAGAVYRVADIEAGVVEVVAWVQTGADDVSDCAWDPESGHWLAASPSKGVFRADASGAVEAMTEPPNGFRLVRAAFYR